MNTVLHTKWGLARLRKDYYYISSRKEGNKGKLLHRLIYESVWGKLPKGYVVHHIDGDKTNNCILNLSMMKETEHLKLHNKGENNHWYGKKRPEHSKRMIGGNNPNYGKHHTEETKQKIREKHNGISYSLDSKLSMSKSKNNTGYFRVFKNKCKKCKQGFNWVYMYYDKGTRKSISSVDIKKLEEKVKAKGLHWEKFE
jgi:hypothetical protein